mmetsp:Transcript_20899/g.53914  ORF Transcript_20899/g.53914 Transcript_20899/m.53914 type:complete len:362 (+) Transcript_20899:1173-2258(+)
MVRPFIAAIESSTKPDSLSVSVWMVMAMSCSSAKLSALSITAGVVPQSSCSFSPEAPASITSKRPSGADVLPLPEKPKFIGNTSVACSIICTCDGAGVHVVAVVPEAGPVPPPYMVVRPEASASSISCGQIQCTCASMPPAVMMSFSPAIASVVTPVTIPGVTPAITSGLPAFPMPTMRLPLMPMSALMMPCTASMMSALVITVSSASRAPTPVAWPMPSRSVLPPPNLHSSPYTVASFSTRANSSVSPSLTQSPTVGPKMSAYCEWVSLSGLPGTAGASLCPNPPACTRAITSGRRSALATPSVSLLPETTRFLPAMSTSVTVFDSPGSKRTLEPAGTLSRRPNACVRSNTSALFVSRKW